MLDETDWSILRELQKGIPLCAHPFREIARRCGLAEPEVLRRVRELCADGVIRRCGARLAHLRAGIAGNVMVAWQVPEEHVDRVGQALAERSEVSHCYQRAPRPDLPYNLYTMIHAQTAEQALSCVEEISQAVGVTEFVTLPTLKELKKTSPNYRPLVGDE